jgi:hypothetical protein
MQRLGYRLGGIGVVARSCALRQHTIAQVSPVHPKDDWTERIRACHKTRPVIYIISKTQHTGWKVWIQWNASTVPRWGSSVV